MSEKKRVRPTLGQVRDLENEVSVLKEQVRLLEMANGYSAEEIEHLFSYKRMYEEQMDGTSVIVADCDAWREKYRKLKKESDTLQKSNSLMEEELKRVRKRAEDATADYNRARREVLFLRSRGFWSRVFNKTCYEK